jgi:hypothetical protein
MNAVDPSVRILSMLLNPRGRPHMVCGFYADFDGVGG